MRASQRKKAPAKKAAPKKTTRSEESFDDEEYAQPKKVLKTAPKKAKGKIVDESDNDDAPVDVHAAQPIQILSTGSMNQQSPLMKLQQDICAAEHVVSRYQVEVDIANWTFTTCKARSQKANSIPDYVKMYPRAFLPSDDSRALRDVSATWETCPEGPAAQQILEKAKQELEKAEQKLKEAKSELANSEQKLKTDPAGLFVQFVQSVQDATIDVDHVNRILKQAMPRIIKADGVHCAPIKVSTTWKEEEIQKKLLEARAVVDNAFKAEPMERAARIMALFAGTGSGKTHILLEAGRLLGADTNIYVTYNMGQGLKFDTTAPKLAIQLRVLLRYLGMSNFDSNKWIDTNRVALSGLDADRLTTVIANIISHGGHKHVFIGVDEIRKLIIGEEETGAIISTMWQLGRLALQLHNVGVKCSVLVSALTESTFKTVSDRDIAMVPMTPPDDTARDAIMAELLDRPTDKQKAMLAAAAGTHFRSLVVGCIALKENCTLSAEILFSNIRRGLTSKLDSTDRTAIASYVKRCVTASVHVALAESIPVAPFLDVSGAIAPAYVYEVFDKLDNFDTLKHPAIRVFGISPFTETTKQLEEVGVAYDQFRALYGLPVVPAGISVGLIAPDDAFFASLRFPKAVASKVENDSLFEVKGKKVQRTTFVPHSNAYCYPSNPSHPLIDRACIAATESGRRCLVIYQDRINATGFPKAVQDLNTAAHMLKRDMKVPVLCVAHVIGASPDTKAQSAFEHPYILIRECEIKQFYTPTFAPAIRFLAHRHMLGDGTKTQ